MNRVYGLIESENLKFSINANLSVVIFSLAHCHASSSQITLDLEFNFSATLVKSFLQDQPITYIITNDF